MQPAGEEATCSLWLMAMDPAAPFARKQTFPISALSAQAEPFALRIGDVHHVGTGRVEHRVHTIDRGVERPWRLQVGLVEIES